MTQSNKRRIAKRRRTAAVRGIMSLIKMAVAVAVIVLILIGIIRHTSQPNVFLNGVYVNGISLGGYTYEEGYNLVTELAEQRLNQNAIELYYGDKTWTLTPSMLSATMDVTSQLALAWNFGHTGNYFQKKSQQDYLKDHAVEYVSELDYDSALLDQFIAQIKSEIDVAPVNATVIVKSDEQLEVTDSSEGLALDGDAVKEALENVIVEGSAPKIELVAQVVRPTVSADDLKGNTQLIATCTTSTKSSSKNRTTNIRRSLSKFNGFVVNPGETVSFNKVVGKRTEANGFKEAPEFAGTSVQTGIGGGVCQASTTLYNALLRAGMTVEVRYQHTMTVSYIPPSLDATVTDGGKDLVFTNNRDSAIYIYVSVDSTRAQVNIYGKPTEYKITLESEIIQDNIVDNNIKKKKDTSGKHAYYTDERVLYSEGKTGLRSRAYICYYDRTTGEEIERDELHTDYYFPSPATYWVGIHERDELDTGDADALP
jgi:vancomycin resistance protein YoaR